MGKKRIIKKGGDNMTQKGRSLRRLPKKKLSQGVIHIRATYNNTSMSLTDMTGNLITTSSSGAMGFRGSKKGTPFAAGKVGELIAEQGQKIGLKEVKIKVNGVGSGRESAIRAFMAKGINILNIKDITPIPFNGPRPPKPRRV